MSGAFQMDFKTDLTIEIEANDGSEIEVVVQGTWENFSSYNPHECGDRITGIEVISPPGFKLTERQREYAEQQLYAAR